MPVGGVRIFKFLSRRRLEYAIRMAVRVVGENNCFFFIHRMVPGY